MTRFSPGEFATGETNPGGKWFNCVVCGERVWKFRSAIEASSTGQFACSREHWQIAHKQFWEKRREVS